MTAHRDPDQLIRAWLDLMPDEAPDRAIASVLQATAAAPQVRDLLPIGRWRSLPMNRFSLGAAAITIVALVGGGLILTRLVTPPNIGPSSVTGTLGPSSNPTPGDSLSPTPGDSLSPTPALSFLPSVGQNGAIVMIVDDRAVAIARDGSRSTLPLEGLFVWSCPSFSSDGRLLAYLANPAGYENRLHQELCVADAEGSNERVLWTGLRVAHSSNEVIWSPGRQRVAASGMFPLSGSGDGPGVAVGRLDGGSATYSKWSGGNLSWSSDSTRLVGTRIDAETGFGVIEIHEPETGSTTTLVTAPDVGSVAWSPDGQTITYAASSVPGGQFALHVIRTDGTDDRVVYTSPPLGPPALLSMRWSPAGDVLALVVYDDDDAGPSFTIELFDRTWAHVGSVGPFSGTDALFTWSPDGRSLLITSLIGVDGPRSARIVQVVGGESTVLDVPQDFTACPIAWGAAVP